MIIQKLENTKQKTTPKTGEASSKDFLKMCGAMDGGAQAHKDVLEAFFKKPLLLADLRGLRQ